MLSGGDGLDPIRQKRGPDYRLSPFLKPTILINYRVD
jgi:hypothetical protein